jgi:hypothetical protein
MTPDNENSLFQAADWSRQQSAINYIFVTGSGL